MQIPFQTARSGVVALTMAAFFAGAACAPAPFDAQAGAGSGGRTGSGGSASTGGSSGSPGGSSGTGGSSGGATGGSSGSSGGSSGSTGGTSGATGGSSGGATGGSSGSSGGSSGSSGGASGSSGGSSGNDAGGGDMGGGTPGAPTFTALFSEIFGTATCNESACHGGTNPKDGVNFNDKAKAHTSLVPMMTMGGNASELVKRLESTNAAQRMPKGKAALSPALIKKVKDWIAAGAKND
jgi:hypothetical protein